MQREVSAGLLWYGRGVAALGVLALAAGMVLETRHGWELPRELLSVFTCAAGTFFFAWTALRPPAALARDDGRKILYVLAGVCFLVAAALWLNTIPEW